MQRFWKKVGTDYKGFRKMCSAVAVDPVYARYEFNPLEARPAIFFSPDEVAVPSISSMFLRFSEGIYRDLFNYFETKGSHYSFTAYFESVFREYVGQQLRHYYGAERVLAERKYPVPGDERSGPDWIVVEGDRAILIECTAARLILPKKSIPTWDLLKSQVFDKLLDDLKSLPAKAEHVREHPEAWPELATVSRYHYVVVTLEQWFATEPFQRIVKQELERHGAIQHSHHLLSVRALETLLCLVPHERLSDYLLSDYLEERIETWKQDFSSREDFKQRCKQLGVESSNELLGGLGEVVHKVMGN